MNNMLGGVAALAVWGLVMWFVFGSSAETTTIGLPAEEIEDEDDVVPRSKWIKEVEELEELYRR